MSSSVVDKRSERIRAMFAGVAPRYDLLNHLLSLNIDRHWRAKTVRVLPPDLGSPQPILDTCTGTGDLAIAYANWLWRNAPDAPIHVVGTDFCHEMLLRATEKSAKRKLPITWFEADSLALPFDADLFQLVTVAFGLRNVADTDGGIRELVRVTAPGGRVGILEFSRPRIPGIRQAYTAYFTHVLPRIGQKVSQSPDAAYEYLPASVMSFPDGPEMVARLEQLGLVEVKALPLTFGIATLYHGRKP